MSGIQTKNLVSKSTLSPSVAPLSTPLSTAWKKHKVDILSKAPFVAGGALVLFGGMKVGGMGSTAAAMITVVAGLAAAGGYFGSKAIEKQSKLQSQPSSILTQKVPQTAGNGATQKASSSMTLKVTPIPAKPWYKTPEAIGAYSAIATVIILAVAYNIMPPGSTPLPPPSPPPKADAPKGNTPKTDAPKADAPKGNTPKTDAPKADAPKGNTPKADAPKADAPKGNTPKADAPKADAPKGNTPKADAPKADAPKGNTPKADAPKGNTPKTDAPKADAPKGNTPKTDAPKADAPKADAPKGNTPKADAPKGNTPKADAPKADAPKGNTPKADAPKADAPKGNTPKADAPKADAPKGNTPKADAPKADAPKDSTPTTTLTPPTKDSTPTPAQTQKRYISEETFTGMITALLTSFAASLSRCSTSLPPPPPKDNTPTPQDSQFLNLCYPNDNDQGFVTFNNSTINQRLLSIGGDAVPATAPLTTGSRVKKTTDKASDQAFNDETAKTFQQAPAAQAPATAPLKAGSRAKKTADKASDQAFNDETLKNIGI